MMDLASSNLILVAAVGIISVVAMFVTRAIVSYHINNEMIRQARGLPSFDKPETRQEAIEAYTAYRAANQKSNLQKAKKYLVWNSAFVWVTLIAFLLVIWNVFANR